MFVKKKTKSNKKSAAKRSKVVVGLRSKLPKSRLKLSYLAVLSVFVFTILGFSGWTAFRYQEHKQFVAEARWSYPYNVGYGISYQVCKRYRGVMGGVHDIYFNTQKQPNAQVTVFTQVERYINNMWTADGPSYATANWSNQWWAGMGNTSMKTVSIWNNERVHYRLVGGGNGYSFHDAYFPANMPDQHLPWC